MEQRELTLAPESVGLRLDRWLAEQCPDLSRSQLQNLIEADSAHPAGPGAHRSPAPEHSAGHCV